MKKITKRILTGVVALSMLGVPSISFAGTYNVQSGDTYWKISQKYNIELKLLLEANGVNGDTILNIGDKLTIPENLQTYTVQKGDTLWKISEKLQVSLIDLMSVNNMDSDDYIYTGQIIKVPTESEVIKEEISTNDSLNYYTVVAGDTPWIISNKLGVSLDKLLSVNNLDDSSFIYIGQRLVIPNSSSNTEVTENANDSNEIVIPEQPSVEITYISHSVEEGENFWTISNDYGLQINELLKANNASSNTVLNIGDIVKIPVYDVGVMNTLGEQYGEYLDWWNAAQYVVPIGAKFKVVDFYTGKSFMAERTTGANHADSETLTVEDTAAMKEIWGGSFSWKSRPIIIEYNGRRIAASASSMPHAGNDSAPGGEYTSWRSDDYGAGLNFDYIKGNGMDGHFDIHFLNSTRHKDGRVDDSHQINVKISAGIIK
ncbi:MAG: LysM peptidoglycan-binding domain-containing protein [Firmicutes bacterium]|nr:LysM peptidoglycan-binding domain-containing protein [Bacillota bacterium]